MPWYKRLMGIDRRILYVIMVIGISFPMFSPIGLPVPEDVIAQAAYDYIANLPAGSNVLYSYDLSASGMTELKPASDVFVDLSFQKGHNVFLMALWAEGNNFSSLWADPIAEKHGAVYGENYINLGFVVSFSAFMEQSRTDLYASLNGGIDKNGEQLSNFPMMKDVTKAADFDAVFSFNTGDPGPTAWIQQWNATEGVAILFSCTSVSTPTMVNYYQSGLLVGNIGGLAGAAWVEKLHGQLGSATGGMDSQSLGHVVIILFLILGNVGYFASKAAGDSK